jgi:predicted aminopeptidase
VVLLLVGGCANVGYYWQSIRGQFDIWSRQRDIASILQSAETPEATRERLATTLRMRAFAVSELGLPDNASYTRYADLGRPYVVWNVFATPELSLKPLNWCFPFAGCVSYRGYFSKEEAEAFAGELAQQGHDVYVGGVPAYSTLGWFADPVLNTVLGYSNPRLALLIFHELAHQVVYVRDDTVFNESFAVAVEREGIRRWLLRHGSAEDQATYERGRARRDDFVGLVETYRGRIKTLYQSGLDPETMRTRKQETFREMARDYLKLKAGWDGFTGYDRWFGQGPNNARLASVSIYTQMVPAFQVLLAREGGELPRFYEAVKALARQPREERNAALRALMPQSVAGVQ